MSPYAQFQLWHTEQGCGDGESLETSANLAVSEIKIKKINQMKYDVTKIERTRL